MGTNVGGINYNDIGSSTSPLLLKSNGCVRILWGNKFIDLVKNGKIASAEAPEIFKTVSSSDEIAEDGIYLVEELLWVSIGGTKLSIPSETENTYVSFLSAQETTSELKSLALTNIGFYYPTLQDALNAQILAGIVYILDVGKLYTILNGAVTEFLSGSGETSSNAVRNFVDALTIQINELEYVKLSEDTIRVSKDIIGNIQSENASETKGFRLYDSINGSTLEVDKVIERLKETTAIEGKVLYDNTLFGVSNIITSNECQPVIENGVLLVDTYNITCQLKYYNWYKVGDKVLISVPIENEKLWYIDFNVTEVSDYSITVRGYNEMDLSDLYVYSMSKPYIKITDSNLEYINGDTKAKIGEIAENLYGFLGNIYDSTITNATLSGNFAKYTEDLTIPENFAEEKLAIPNVEWVLKLISYILPSGSIIMWHGTEIPNGWAICNGENGTPNLIGKFIKASNTVGENTTDLSADNILTISLDNLPKHSHPHLAHTHNAETVVNVTTEVKNTSTLTVNTDVVSSVNVSTTDELAPSGTIIKPESADHTILNSELVKSVSTSTLDGEILSTATSTVNSSKTTIKETISNETNIEWPNKPIKVEPHAYSLIFIMKL